MMHWTGKTLIFPCLLALLARAHVFSLSDLDWTLRNENGSVVVPGSVPSQAHLDLFKAGVIDDPLLGINQYTERWVVNDNWTYTADLTPFAQYNENDGSDRTLLVFYGLDTIANITFAGHPVAWVNNQFRKYIYDVTGYIQSPIGGDKNLTIAFESAWYYGLNVSSRPDVELLTDIVQTMVTFQYPNREFVRKAGGDFGWDWSPAFLPSGIYKPAYLVTLSDSNASSELPGNSDPYVNNAVLVEETSVDIYKEGQTVSSIDQSADWIVNITLGIRSIKSYADPTVTLSIPELGITSEPMALGSIPAGTSETTYLSANWSIADRVPERWYPHTLGVPKLYNLTVSVDLSGSLEPGDDCVVKTITTGFRTIQLIQTAYSEEDISLRGIRPGDQWHFEMNGKAFFTKGINILPADLFYSRVDPDHVRWLLESAVQSGHNMIVAWGGGVYQPSDAATDGGIYDFYSVCDELGLLTFSDLALSDQRYPTNSWWLESLEPEIRQNVRRVNRHPSNAIWAAGNELEFISLLALRFEESVGQHLVDEFVYFANLVHDIILSETRSVSYLDSSYTSGVLSLDPYELRLNNATPGYLYGNQEGYNYDATQMFNLSSFFISRFISMPSFYTWQDVLENQEDFSFNSSVVMSRDLHPPAGNLSFPNPRAPQGQSQMTNAVELWLPTPGTSDSNQTFTQWCWSTQVIQSMETMAQIAWYRRGAGMEENTLGSLLWHLNDVWQGISWSAIEHSGRWKVLNYGLASVHRPVIIQPFWMPENETLTILATSDLLEPVDGVAQLTWYDWSGRMLNTSRVSFTTPTLNNSLVYEGTGLKTILPTGSDASDVWLLMNVTAQVDDKTVTSESYFTPVSLAQAPLVDPKIAVKEGDDYTFTLSAEGGVAAWAWLDHPHGTLGYFVDTMTWTPSNGFYLVPGIDRTVKFILNDKMSSVRNPDPSDFVVRSLWNNTHI